MHALSIRISTFIIAVFDKTYLHTSLRNLTDLDGNNLDRFLNVKRYAHLHNIFSYTYYWMYTFKYNARSISKLEVFTSEILATTSWFNILPTTFDFLYDQSVHLYFLPVDTYCDIFKFLTLLYICGLCVCTLLRDFSTVTHAQIPFTSTRFGLTIKTGRDAKKCE